MVATVYTVFPLVSAANQALPLRAVCNGKEPGISVRLEIYHGSTKSDKATVAVVHENGHLYARSIVLNNDALEVGNEKPLLIKSTTNSPDFFVDMGHPTSQYHGLYTINVFPWDQTIMLACEDIDVKSK